MSLYNMTMPIIGLVLFALWVVWGIGLFRDRK